MAQLATASPLHDRPGAPCGGCDHADAIRCAPLYKAGLGMGIPLVALHEERGWVPGIVLLCIGLALLISARIIHPIGNGDSR